MIRSAAALVAGIDVSALTSLEGGLCLFLMLVNLNVGQASSVKLIPASSFLNRVHVMRSGFLWERKSTMWWNIVGMLAGGPYLYFPRVKNQHRVFGGTQLFIQDSCGLFWLTF
jgi:hypothetical protein